MEYLSIRQLAEKWGISARRINVLCSEGRIEGAMHTAEFRSYYDGNYWNRIGGTPESARRISGTTQ